MSPEDIAEEMIARHSALQIRGQFVWAELKHEIVAAIKNAEKPAPAPVVPAPPAVEIKAERPVAPKPVEPEQPFIDEPHPFHREPLKKTAAKPKSKPAK